MIFESEDIFGAEFINDPQSSLKFSIFNPEHDLPENDAKKLYEESDPLQFSMNDSDQNNPGFQHGRNSFDNNSDAKNFLNKNTPSTLTTTNLKFEMTLRKKIIKIQLEDILKKKSKTPKRKIKSSCLRNKHTKKSKEIGILTSARKSITNKPQPILYRKTSYDMMRLHCPTCNKDLSLTDTVYVRSEPRNCENCNSRIKFVCKKCEKMFNTRIIIQDHIRLICGQSPKFKCAHCTYKAYRKASLREHLLTKHGFVPNINVHSPPKNFHQEIQYNCPKCKKELTAEETTNRADTFLKYCKQCDTEISFTCKQCNRIYKYINCLRRHAKNCGKSRSIYICSQCDYQSLYKKRLETHIRKKHQVASADAKPVQNATR